MARTLLCADFQRSFRFVILSEAKDLQFVCAPANPTPVDAHITANPRQQEYVPDVPPNFNPPGDAMENEKPQKIKVQPQTCSGMVWIGGWLFTVGFLHLAFWRGVLAIVLWPYYLGVHFGH